MKRDVDDCQTVAELQASLAWKLDANRYDAAAFYRLLAWAERALDTIVQDTTIAAPNVPPE